jgi:hypothetical protein
MDVPAPHEIVELALHHLAGRGARVDVANDGLVTGDGRVYGLEPLRRRLAGLERTRWGEAVRAHFRALDEVDPTMPESFSSARAGLRSAVVSEADLGMFDGALAERPLVDGLGERLMLKRGSFGLTVTTEVIEGWGVAPGEVWETARRNAMWDEPLTPVRSALHLTLIGGSWTSTCAVDVSRFLEDGDDFGALLTVPSRHEVLVHTIRDETFMDAAVAMLSATAATFSSDPLPVSCDLFWWHDHRLHRICTPGPDGYRYLRVAPFSQMLWGLESSIEA